MKSVIILGMFGLGAPGLRAAAPAAQWTGGGTLYDAQRVVVDTYSLDVSIQPGAGPGEQRTVVRVVGHGGFTFTQTCLQKQGDSRWTKTCDDGGSGGGYLFDKGLGTDYYRAADGKAYATTIVIDGPDKMRLQRTELSATGDALHFYSEELTKAAK